MKDECREITVGQLTKEIGAIIGIPMEATDRVDPLFKNEQLTILRDNAMRFIQL